MGRKVHIFTDIPKPTTADSGALFPAPELTLCATNSQLIGRYFISGKVRVRERERESKHYNAKEL